MPVVFLTSRLTMPRVRGYLGDPDRSAEIVSVALSVLHILSGVWLGRPRLLSGVESGVADLKTLALGLSRDSRTGITGSSYK